MQLDRVTLTGADDSVSVNDLIRLSSEFPFVEWGILVHQATASVSASSWAPRWPSLSWLMGLQSQSRHIHRMQLSLHLCGHWVRELLVGRNHIPASFFDEFQRVQLNFHAENTPCETVAFHQALRQSAKGREIIFQIDDNGGNEHMAALWDEIDRGSGHIDTVPLFDVSGGAGVVPHEWPKPSYMANDSDYVYHGYAGGLGPDNVLSELHRIAAAAGDCRIWIDMETKIRSKLDSVFDLEKCRSVLEQVATLVGK